MIRTMNVGQYRNRMTVLSLFKDTDVVSRMDIETAFQSNDVRVLMALKTIERQGLIVLQKIMQFKGGKGKYVGAEITKRGRHFLSMIPSNELEAVGNWGNGSTGRELEAMPCGAMMRVCWMGTKCYHHSNCKIAVKN